MCIFYFRVVSNIFISVKVGALATVLLMIYHWHIGISLTPALDVYYLTLIMAGIYFGLKWLYGGNFFQIFLSSLAFATSTGFHYQAWMVLFVLDLGVGWYL